MNFRLILTGTLVIVCCIITSTVFAQDKSRTRLSMTCTQVMPSSMRIDVRLLGRIDNRYTPLSSKAVSFAFGSDSDDNLGIDTTDRKGEASIFIEDISNWEFDEDSLFLLSTSYAGNEEFRSSSDEVYIRRATLEAQIDEEARILEIEARDYFNESQKLGDFEVTFSVPRMFSELKIEEDYLDEEGSISFTFDDNIPGDEEGNLNLFIRVLDTDDHGNIEYPLNKKWGVPKERVIEANRELWSPDAPLWMVLTFGMLMLLVWGHFAYIIVSLINIKKLGN